MTDDDATLVQHCLTGDELALRTFTSRYQKMVFGICYRMLSHREDAEDVTQDVFLRIFRNLHRWESDRPLKPWLVTITANRCRTVLKKRLRIPIPSEFADEQITDHRLTQSDLGEELQLALETIRDEYRACFILFYQQKLSCIEIGEILDCPEGTVKTWLHRARRQLAEFLRRRGITPHAEQLH